MSTWRVKKLLASDARKKGKRKKLNPSSSRFLAFSLSFSFQPNVAQDPVAADLVDLPPPRKRKSSSDSNGASKAPSSLLPSPRSFLSSSSSLLFFLRARRRSARIRGLHRQGRRGDPQGASRRRGARGEAGKTFEEAASGGEEKERKRRRGRRRRRRRSLPVLLFPVSVFVVVSAGGPPQGPLVPRLLLCPALPLLALLLGVLQGHGERRGRGGRLRFHRGAALCEDRHREAGGHGEQQEEQRCRL